MVFSGIVSMRLLSVAKLSTHELFLVVSLLNIVVKTYVRKILPRFTVQIY